MYLFVYVVLQNIFKHKTKVIVFGRWDGKDLASCFMIYWLCLSFKKRKSIEIDCYVVLCLFFMSNISILIIYILKVHAESPSELWLEVQRVGWSAGIPSEPCHA